MTKSELSRLDRLTDLMIAGTFLSVRYAVLAAKLIDRKLGSRPRTDD